MQLCVSTNINSSPDNVWQAITDFEHCENWIDGILNLTILEQPENGLVGFKWQETRKMFGKEATEIMWITGCVHGESYTTRAENCGAIYVSKLTVIPEGKTTKLTMEFSGTSESWLVNLMSKLMGFFMTKSMIKMLEDDLADIKAHVESNNH